MASVVESLSRALARGTCSCGKISGSEPLSAGLNSAELAPMQKSMASMPPQFRVSRPQAPASMAETSSSLAASTTCRLGKRSASQPAQAEKSTNGSEKSTVPQACTLVSCRLMASSSTACLKKLSLKVPSV